MRVCLLIEEFNIFDATATSWAPCYTPRLCCTAPGRAQGAPTQSTLTPTLPPTLTLPLRPSPPDYCDRAALRPLAIFGSVRSLYTVTGFLTRDEVHSTLEVKEQVTGIQ